MPTNIARSIIKIMRKILAFVTLAPFLFAVPVYAHEAYVLPQYEFSSGLKTFTHDPLRPLLDPSHAQISAVITLFVFLGYIVSFFWATTKPAALLDKYIRKAAAVGPLIIRVAISTSLFFSAQSNVILGPELTLSEVSGGVVIRFLLFLISVMILLGIFTEIAAFIGLCIFVYVAFFFDAYLITYANYFGELTVLFLFGSRFLSFDNYLFGKKLYFNKIKKYAFLEVPIVRVLYGVALIYAGISIKFLHQDLSIAVYNQYHLKDFFHASADFIAAGAGLSEVTIGFFILLGFAQRLTILISLVFITLSIFYFRELLWPHLMLYGISFSLLINSADLYTLDRYAVPLFRSILRKIFTKH